MTASLVRVGDASKWVPVRVDCLTCISLHEHEGIYHTSRVLTTGNNGHKSDHIWLHIGLEDLLEHFKGFTRLLILTVGRDHRVSDNNILLCCRIKQVSSNKQISTTSIH